MNEKQTREFEKVIEEQMEMRGVEKFAGNIVKEEFHKGAVFGLKMALGIMIDPELLK